MSTHCGIAIKRKDGSVKGTYCHFDGYVEGGVGESLNSYFKDLSSVDSLISGGDLRCVEDSKYEYLDDEAGFEKEFSSFEDFLDSDLGSLEYEYVFDENKNRWFVATPTGSGFKDLNVILTAGSLFDEDGDTEPVEECEILEDYFDFKNGDI